MMSIFRWSQFKRSKSIARVGFKLISSWLRVSHTCRARGIPHGQLLKALGETRHRSASPARGRSRRCCLRGGPILLDPIWVMSKRATPTKRDVHASSVAVVMNSVKRSDMSTFHLVKLVKICGGLAVSVELEMKYGVAYGCRLTLPKTSLPGQVRDKSPFGEVRQIALDTGMGAQGILMEMSPECSKERVC